MHNSTHLSVRAFAVRVYQERVSALHICLVDFCLDSSYSKGVLAASRLHARDMQSDNIAC